MFVAKTAKTVTNILKSSPTSVIHIDVAEHGFFVEIYYNGVFSISEIQNFDTDQFERIGLN